MDALETWLNFRERTLQESEVGQSIDTIEEQIRKHHDFEQMVHAQEGKFNDITRLTLVSFWTCWNHTAIVLFLPFYFFPFQFNDISRFTFCQGYLCSPLPHSKPVANHKRTIVQLAIRHYGNRTLRLTNEENIPLSSKQSLRRTCVTGISMIDKIKIQNKIRIIVRINYPYYKNQTHSTRSNLTL